MNKIVFLFLLSIFICCRTNDKVNNLNIDSKYIDSCNYYYDTILKMNVYTKTDIMPEYNGDSNEILKDLYQSINLSKVDTFQTVVNLEFIISVDGNLIEEKIVNKKELTDLEIEVLKALKVLQKWKPGKCNGENVPVKYYLKVRFSPSRINN